LSILLRSVTSCSPKPPKPHDLIFMINLSRLGESVYAECELLTIFYFNNGPLIYINTFLRALTFK